MRKFFITAVVACAGAGMLGGSSTALAAPVAAQDTQIPFTWLHTVEGMGELLFTDIDRPTNTTIYTYDLNGDTDAVMTGLLDQVIAHGGYECTNNPPEGDTHTINTCDWLDPNTDPESFIYALRLLVATDGTESPSGHSHIAQVLVDNSK